MPESGFDSILTVWSWPTIPWWLVAGLMFALIMLIWSAVAALRREPRPAIITAVLAVVAGAGSVIAFLLLPNTTSVTETTHVIAEGQIVESTRVAGEQPALHVRLDTDPTWLLVLTGEDADAMADATGTVTLQCEWGTTSMDCATAITGAPRPIFVPWWAETEQMHAVLLPAAVEG